MFTEYSNDMNDVFTNTDDYSKQRKRKVLIIFYDMIADIMSSKNFKAIIKELFIRCRKLNVSIAFITQSYFRTPKDARLNSMHYVIMKIQVKKSYKTLHKKIQETSILKIFSKFTKIIQANLILA